MYLLTPFLLALSAGLLFVLGYRLAVHRIRREMDKRLRKDGALRYLNNRRNGR